MMRRLLVLGWVVAATAGGQQPAIQRGVVIEPDTVTVGDPFRIVLRIRAPLGSTIEFPGAPDSATGVEALDPVDVVPSLDTTAVEQTATYRVAAWDVGDLSIRFEDVLVQSGTESRRVAVGTDLRVFVESVLPADSALRVPKPARPVIEFGLPWWFWLLVALAVAAVLAPLIWWWTRRRQPRAADVDPYDAAVREFERIEELGLIGAGERGHYVAIVTDVLRTYLSRVIGRARSSSTTSELASALRGDGRVPLTRLVRVLHDADLVKFAREPVSEDDARTIGADTRKLVDDVHDALQPREVSAAA
jgi:hypothetical protein